MGNAPPPPAVGVCGFPLQRAPMRFSPLYLNDIWQPTAACSTRQITSYEITQVVSWRRWQRVLKTLSLWQMLPLRRCASPNTLSRLGASLSGRDLNFEPENLNSEPGTLNPQPSIQTPKPLSFNTHAKHQADGKGSVPQAGGPEANPTTFD